MSNKTKNYNLTKPEENEYYDIKIPNDNVDVIDEELKKAENHRNNTDNPHKVTAAQVGASNPNLGINCDFRVNQRGKGTYGYGYTFDRWISTGSVSDIDVAIVRGQIASGGRYFVNLKVNSVTNVSGNNFQQFLEDSENGMSPLAGETITFSVNADTSAGCDYRCVFIGYKATPSATNISFKLTAIPGNTGGGIRYSVTATLPDTACNVIFGIGITRGIVPADATTYINFYDAKLEVGSVPTPFVPRPYAEELALCKRYYQRNAYIASRVQEVYAPLKLVRLIRQEHDIEMRVAPAVALLNNRVHHIRTFNSSVNIPQPTTDQIVILDHFDCYNTKMYCPLMTLGTLPADTDYIIDLLDNTFAFDAEIY